MFTKEEDMKINDNIFIPPPKGGSHCSSTNENAYSYTLVGAVMVARYRSTRPLRQCVYCLS